MSNGCECHCSCSATATHEHGGLSQRGEYLRLGFSVAMLAVGLLLALTGFDWWGMAWPALLYYLAAYLPVALPVAKGAWELFRRERSVFNEFTLMLIATIGAFYIGEYPEAVVLMVLYSIGEILQARAVWRARKDIGALLDVRPERVRRLRDGIEEVVSPADVRPGEVIRLLPGERLPLDGVLMSQRGVLDTSALTGETKPMDIETGASVLAGAIVQSMPIEVCVDKPFGESMLAKILKMVEESGAHKSKTEEFIRRFARIYTPIVTLLALLIVLLPYLWSLSSGGYDYVFDDWLYRGLVFLVTSCPCALVISVPLSYFAGVGSASRHGLLFKGSAHLDKLRSVTVFALDKTGTVTCGTFDVVETHLSETAPGDTIAYLCAVEAHSTHPIAQTICHHFTSSATPPKVYDVEEVAGMGLRAKSEAGEEILVGSIAMMQSEGVTLPDGVVSSVRTTVLIAIAGVWAGAVMLDDKIKDTSREAIDALHRYGIRDVTILSGDRPESVARVAAAVGADTAVGGLLPGDKVDRVREMMREGEVVAFVGDGLNDAPVMAMSDLSFAMGGIGSDAAIEAADIVIQSDDPAKLPQSIDIARYTYRIVLQNISFALGFKVLIMALASLGVASLALAIIADVGVSLLTVLNTLRVLKHSPQTER